MPKKTGKKKYTAKQMKIARVALPRDKITRADFAKLRGRKKTWLNFVQKVKLLLNESLKYTPLHTLICMRVVYVQVESNLKKQVRKNNVQRFTIMGTSQLGRHC